ncbi:CAP domain-containing protein [uncultured Paracoccus sp.]|uniref:CAP domain-containing protein n=1 Tax=uncultured Paracoccus sp. TaxID=189685 RepID=UPI0025F7AE29|nr:CAP domain-containing protein [uncultured Paracoccus sp.]
MIHPKTCILPLLACMAISACAPTGSGTSGSGLDIQASAAGPASCSPTTAAQVAAGVRATNALRARSNLPPVTARRELSVAAAQHACDMAERGRMTHAGSRTSGPAQRVKAQGYAPRVTAENIAAGPFDIERVLAEWNNSPGHQANILISPVRHFGIGHAMGADGKTRYWAAVYAAPR